MKNENQSQSSSFESIWAEKQEQYRIIEPEPSQEEKDYKRMMNKMFYRHNYYDEDDYEFKFDGLYAGEYFLTAFYYGKRTFFGVEFDDIDVEFYPWNQDIERHEYDLVMFSETAVAIIEIEYKACVKDIAYILEKVAAFKLLTPDYANCKIYVGLVTQSFSPELEQECIKQGIIVIKQIDGTVVINDAHLKVF